MFFRHLLHSLSRPSSSKLKRFTPCFLGNPSVLNFTNLSTTRSFASPFSVSELKIFSGNAHPSLAQEISTLMEVMLKRPLAVGEATVKTFANGETQVLIHESVRDCDVYVVQPTCNPNPNDYIMELVIMLDAFRRAGAARITAVMPIFGYARQDRKDKSRASIACKVIADMLQTAGVDRVITVDLHASQIQGFVNFPMDNLFGSPIIEQYLRSEILSGDTSNLVVVSPDAGGAKRAEAVAEKLGSDLAIISKKRDSPGSISNMILVGEVEEKFCVIVDDMADTAGTLATSANLLKERGASEVYAGVTHGVLSDPALTRIAESELSQLIVLDTIPMAKNQAILKDKLKVLKVAPLLAMAIYQTHFGGSLTELFDASPEEQFPDLVGPAMNTQQWKLEGE